ncbi:DNA (cytosine-5-)-methyltransferase [Stutzerimonas degradans]|nr:DNA (cytosine-5-)-methyltransferase [Stutzerimonas degradans]
MPIIQDLSAVSLFSGAGGMDVGFASAGIRPVFANELDEAASRTYAANHGDHVQQGSILDHFDSLKRHRGVDVVFGGPPCQGFSVAGKMDPNDERSGLIRTFFDVVDVVQPHGFVCENVKALAVLSRWAGVRDELVLRSSKHHFSAMVVLNSSDYGVPQNRERMFLVGVRKGGFVKSDEHLYQLFQSELVKHRKSAPTVADLIRKLGRAGSLGNARVCNAKITYASNPVLRKSPYAGMMFNGAGRPLNPLGHACTLPASMGGNKTPIVDEEYIFNGGLNYIDEYHRHLVDGGVPKRGQAPKRLRRLTVDECLAIQTFPSDYTLIGSQSSAYKQIGNAVPCLLAEAVAASFKRILTMNYQVNPASERFVVCA